MNGGNSYDITTPHSMLWGAFDIPFPLNCRQFVYGDVAIDHVIGRVRSGARWWWGVVADWANLSRAAAGEKAPPKGLSHCRHGAR